MRGTKTVKKFNKYGRGIFTGFSRPSENVRTSTRSPNEYIYADLINPKLFNVMNLKELLSKLNKKNSDHVNDPEIFPESPVYLTHVSPTGEIVKFNYSEAYELVRAAYIHQLGDTNIVATRNRIALINKELATLETKAQKKKRLTAELKKLNSKL